MATRLYHRAAFLQPQVCDTKFHAPPQQRHGVVSQARPGLRDYDMVTVINSTHRTFTDLLQQNTSVSK